MGVCLQYFSLVRMGSQWLAVDILAFFLLCFFLRTKASPARDGGFL
jgi:hypothetical protein